MHNKKSYLSAFSKNNVRNLGQAVKKGGKIINLGGKALLYAGATNPELIPIGTGAMELATGVKQAGSILKKISKKKKK